MQEYARSKAQRCQPAASAALATKSSFARASQAGNFLNQELALITARWTRWWWTCSASCRRCPKSPAAFIPRSSPPRPRSKITGAVHVEFDEHKALDQARELVKWRLTTIPIAARL